MMLDPEKSVFISYRREPSWAIARLIFNELCNHGFDVFMDVESIDSGTFDTMILNQIAARAHFLVILTPGTVERCAEPGDWLRREIEYAMDLQRNIVPVMVYGFTFDESTKACLTGKLTRLASFNGPTIYHEYFEAGMEKLRRRFLKQPTYGPITPAPDHELPTVERKLEQAYNQPPPTRKELNAEDYFNRGIVFYNKQDYDQAITNYTTAIELNPNSEKTYNNRGIAHKAKGDLSSALADYTQAIELNPEDPEPYYNRGVAYKARGDLDKALADYDRAIELNPQFAEAYNNRGIARSEQGDLQGAVDDYTKAIELNSLSAKAYNNRGNSYYDLGDLEKAIADYSKALELMPDSAQRYQIFNNRGEAYFAVQQYDQALTDFHKANELHPADNMVLAGMAVTYYALGQKDDATRLWRLLFATDERYNDIDWLKVELYWADQLVEQARKLIDEL